MERLDWWMIPLRKYSLRKKSRVLFLFHYEMILSTTLFIRSLPSKKPHFVYPSVILSPFHFHICWSFTYCIIEQVLILWVMGFVLYLAQVTVFGHYYTLNWLGSFSDRTVYCNSSATVYPQAPSPQHKITENFPAKNKHQRTSYLSCPHFCNFHLHT